MKKFTLIILVAILSFAACQDMETTLVKESILSAVIEQDDLTRTEMDENNNVLWSENDQIIAFLKTSYGHKYQVKPSFIGKSYADFSMVSSNSGNDLSAGNEWEHNVAYYPYSSTIECLKSGDHYVLDVVLPSEQAYVPESFGNGSMAMVAVSEDNNITFNNILGGMKLQLKGTQKVKSITLQGNNNEKLSGSATVTAYTNDTKPAVTMDSNAFTSVTLNCGEGIQLDESESTEFIIILPPVAFCNGFIVAVDDSDGKTYTMITDKANTVMRSSLLIMPVFTLGSDLSDDESEGDDELIIPVSYVDISPYSINLYDGDIVQLVATVHPKDASDKDIIWSSDNQAVAYVEQNGMLTAMTAGTAKITATAGGQSATRNVTVSPRAEAIYDYIDEYGINHGKGVAIGGSVWAPVNCGYHATDYKYGKLYQWGRKYGQGYDENDLIVPSLTEGGVSEIGGNHSSNANVFYMNIPDWVDPRNNDALWNSESESNPIKAEYDPCPEGWRIPTSKELGNLISNKSSWTIRDEQKGYWFSGSSSYTPESSQIFLPAAGYRFYKDGDAQYRNTRGYYWSTTPRLNFINNGYYYAYYLSFNNSDVSVYRDYERANGSSIRCVQE